MLMYLYGEVILHICCLRYCKGLRQDQKMEILNGRRAAQRKILLFLKAYESS